MSLRVVTYPRGKHRVILETCPVCEYDFDRDESRHTHLATHDPEDFGLSPAGEIAEGHDAPLFGGEWT